MTGADELHWNNPVPQILLDSCFLTWIYYYTGLGIYPYLLSLLSVAMTRLIMFYGVVVRSDTCLRTWRAINLILMNLVGYLPLLFFGSLPVIHGLDHW